MQMHFTKTEKAIAVLVVVTAAYIAWQLMRPWV